MGKFGERRKAKKEQKQARPPREKSGKAREGAKSFFSDLGKKIGGEASGGLLGFINKKTNGGLDRQLNTMGNTQMTMFWQQNKMKVIIAALILFGGIIASIMIGKKS